MPEPGHGHGELAVVYGGPSAEHEISCISARRIVQTALDNDWSVIPIGLTHDKQWVDARSVLVDIAAGDTDHALVSPDDLLRDFPDSRLEGLHAALPPRTADPDARPVVFPVLHGPFGEDGVIQGHLEALGLPYVGAGVLSSAMCMDKGIAKSVLHDHGLPVGAWRVAHRHTWSRDLLDEAAAALGLPLFVKPANLGSSVGVVKAADTAAIGDAVTAAFEFDDLVILEEFIRGRELELGALGNEDVRITKAGEIIASREFYDYDDKYVLGAAETVAPTDLTPTQLAHAQRVATAAYRALRVEGLARVDLFLAEDDEIIVNEVNTMPGFTPISMFPMLWEAEGLSFAAVLDELVALGRARHARRRSLRTHRLP
ncbi:MAG TPA: D-alanine--D-alanine ligase family protein [Acidimicrobiales bacterium]|jgi:D-alanine-D-alanine ligase|nr:D-alanine--D-alanine ligase family protein [Acidimicrobiales bacterium]